MRIATRSMRARCPRTRPSSSRRDHPVVSRISPGVSRQWPVISRRWPVDRSPAGNCLRQVGGRRPTIVSSPSRVVRRRMRRRPARFFLVRTAASPARASTMVCLGGIGHRTIRRRRPSGRGCTRWRCLDPPSQPRRSLRLSTAHPAGPSTVLRAGPSTELRLLAGGIQRSAQRRTATARQRRRHPRLHRRRAVSARQSRRRWRVAPCRGVSARRFSAVRLRRPRLRLRPHLRRRRAHGRLHLARRVTAVRGSDRAATARRRAPAADRIKSTSQSRNQSPVASQLANLRQWP